MLIPGPSTTCTPCARASVPSASPTRRASPGSNDDASADAVGKQVAGRLPEIRVVLALSGLARKPCGPSAIVIAGIPSRGTGGRVPEIGAQAQRSLLLQCQRRVSSDRAPTRRCASP